jgi:nucleoside 2-deoxyribosyltransferase
MSKTVYLSGPIAGLTYDDSEDWRYAAECLLEQYGITALSPLRHQQFLRQHGRLTATAEEGANLSPLTTSRGIMTRDRFDATRCDVLLVNFLGATRVSVGTVMEIAWADLKRTPIVCIMEQGNVHEHCMISEAIGFRVGTLEDAIDTVAAILA